MYMLDALGARVHVWLGIANPVTAIHSLSVLLVQLHISD